MPLNFLGDFKARLHCDKNGKLNQTILFSIDITVQTPPPVAMIPIFTIPVIVIIGCRIHFMTTLNDGKNYFLLCSVRILPCRSSTPSYMHMYTKEGCSLDLHMLP